VDPQPFENYRVRPPMFRWGGIQNLAATNCDHGRVLSDDEAITRQHERRLFKPDLNERRLAGLERLFPEQNDVSHQLCCPDMKPYSFADFDRSVYRSQQL